MKTSEIHIKAEQARENDSLLEALRLYEEAFVEYQKEQNYEGIAEALVGKFLTYRHLYFTSQDEVFLIPGKSSLQTSLEIAEKYSLQERLSGIQFAFGQLHMVKKEYADAVEHYKKSMELFTGSEAQKGNIMYHLGEAMYKNNQKEEGERTILDGLELLQKNALTVDSYVYNVWESGAYLILANLCYDEKPDLSKEYLEKAKQIIDADERLIIRKRQYTELKNKLHHIQEDKFKEEGII